MRHNQIKASRQNPALALVPVRFEFTHPTARSVCVAGTFNNWQADDKLMHPAGYGHWLRDAVLAPGDYEYCLVVDGQWIQDPLVQESVANPFGGRNSVLKVSNATADAHLAAAEILPLKKANRPNPNII